MRMTVSPHKPPLRSIHELVYDDEMDNPEPGTPGSPIDEGQRLVSQAAMADAASAHEPGDDAVSAQLRLSPMDVRMLGSLAEKAFATPQNYPLSINSLATACNQTTNRDPLTHYSEGEIADQLSSLKERGLLRFVHPTSGRGVTKYRHVLDEHLGLGDAEIALLSVLFVRGPQTLAELRSRTERLHRFDSTGEIEECLTSMRSSTGQTLTERLEREPGHREPRWIQLLCPEQGEARAGATASANPTGSSHEPPSPLPGLHDEIKRLRNDLTALREEFEAFRAEFG